MKYSSKIHRITKAFSWLLFGNAVERRRVRLELARITASWFGDFPLGDDYKLWLEDKNFRDKFNELSPLSPYSMERKWTLREFARYASNIPGSIAECGCFDGASAFFLAYENPDVPLHLFDSFEGLSEPDEIDKPRKNNERAWQKGDLSISEQVARSRLKDFKNIHFHKGWIPDKFPAVSNDTFRLVHIDVDLYQPTYDSLEFFHPRLHDGGIIVLDDYGFVTCPGAFHATNDYLIKNDIKKHVLMLPTGQGILFKQEQPYSSA